MYQTQFSNLDEDIQGYSWKYFSRAKHSDFVMILTNFKLQENSCTEFGLGYYSIYSNAITKYDNLIIPPGASRAFLLIFLVNTSKLFISKHFIYGLFVYM